MFEGTAIARTQDNLPLVVGLICLVILAAINFRYKKKMLTQLSAFVNPRLAAQVMREESSSAQTPMLLLTIHGLLSLALAAYLVFKYLSMPLGQSWENYFLLLAATTALLVFIFVISFLVNGYTGVDAGLSEYRYGFLLHIQMLGVVALPLSLVMAYSVIGADVSLYVFLFFLVLTYLYRLVRAVFIGVESRVSLVFIILYLCTLEILPLVVAIGLLNGEIIEINLGRLI